MLLYDWYKIGCRAINEDHSKILRSSLINSEYSNSSIIKPAKFGLINLYNENFILLGNDFPSFLDKYSYQVESLINCLI